MKPTNNKAFAEIIESSLHTFLAQSWQWDAFPSFGSIICIKSGDRTIFGVVHQIQTGSMDSSRYPFAYQKTEEELKTEQPQIFEFLKTTFKCLTIAYQEKGHVSYMLPPEPPKIHAFAQLATPDQAKRLFHSDKYLHILFGLSNELFNLDELLLAILKHQKTLGILSQDKIKQFIGSFSLLTGNDYRRLKLFLQRVNGLTIPL